MSAKKYIPIPEPLSGYPFFAFVAWVVDNAKEFNDRASSLRAGQRILEAIEKADAGVAELEADDHKKLSDVLESEGAPFPSLSLSRASGDGEAVSVPVPRRALLPFIDAVDQATNSRPKQLPATNGVGESAAASAS